MSRDVEDAQIIVGEVELLQLFALLTETDIFVQAARYFSIRIYLVLSF